MRVVAAEGRMLDDILSATYEIWHEGLGRAAYPRYYKGQLETPWGRTNLRRWALVDGAEVLASLKEYSVAATLDGRDVRVLGIGAVFTQPRHRGRGHARALVEWSLERAGTDRVDLALLFSEIGAEYYARLGFEVVPTVDLELKVVEDSRRGAPAMLVRTGDDRDLAALAVMGASRAEPFRFHLKRSPDLIHYALVKKRLLAALSPPGARSLQFFVAEEGGAAVAYVFISTRGPLWVVEEAGDRDPTGARLGAILQTLIAREPAERRPTIRASFPDTLRPPQIHVVREGPSPDVMMIKPLVPREMSTPPLGRADVLYWRSDLF